MEWVALEAGLEQEWCQFVLRRGLKGEATEKKWDEKVDRLDIEEKRLTIARRCHLGPLHLVQLPSSVGWLAMQVAKET